MTEVYSELYNVPSGVVFWRGRVANQEGRLAIVDGVAISESSDTSRKLVAKLTGGAGFQKEGDFTARAVAPGDDPATLPRAVKAAAAASGPPRAARSASTRQRRLLRHVHRHG